VSDSIRGRLARLERLAWSGGACRSCGLLRPIGPRGLAIGYAQEQLAAGDALADGLVPPPSEWCACPETLVALAAFWRFQHERSRREKVAWASEWQEGDGAVCADFDPMEGMDADAMPTSVTVTEVPRAIGGWRPIGGPMSPGGAFSGDDERLPEPWDVQPGGADGPLSADDPPPWLG